MFTRSIGNSGRKAKLVSRTVSEKGGKGSPKRESLSQNQDELAREGSAKRSPVRSGPAPGEEIRSIGGVHSDVIQIRCSAGSVPGPTQEGTCAHEGKFLSVRTERRARTCCTGSATEPRINHAQDRRRGARRPGDWGTRAEPARRPRAVPEPRLCAVVLQGGTLSCCRRAFLTVQPGAAHGA